MKKWLTLPIIGIILSLSSNLQAAVLYDNGAPSNVAGLTVTGDGGSNPIGAIFDDFVMTQPGVIDSVEFWTLESTTDAIWDGSVNLFITTDDGSGLPDLGGIQVAGLATLVSKTSTGVIVPGNNSLEEFHYVVNLPTPGTFAPQIGVKYWLGLYLGYNSNQLFWEYTSANGTDPAQAFIPDPTRQTLGSFVGSPVHVAFKLNGTQIPNPAPLALIGLGILAMGVRRKR